MKKPFFAVLFLILAKVVTAQTNVRAWYADGQVFVVWQWSLPIEETYGIYAGATPFTQVTNASLIGRPFVFEYVGFGLKDNLADTSATYRIPDGQGGLYQLGIQEGLFVFTPHQSGSLYFAVVRWGTNTVVPGQNITASAVPFTYDPVNDPVECHLQRIFSSPFTPGYACFAYMMWADGRQNHWDGRADFPIMANAPKNGMPALFLVSAPINLDTSIAFPLSVWLHGGGGIARQSLAGSRREININPELGILVAHDDKMYGYRGNTGPHPDQPTWHFGWAKNYNPFVTNINLVADTIINYTQRRYLWIDHWLSKHFHIDTNRIHIHGHSMGSAGALALAKSYPAHYGSAGIFNTGCAGPEDASNTIYIFGNKADNFPTNLTNRNSAQVRFFDLWDLYTNCSPERDLPLIKHWHGKNDDNGTMRWSPVVVQNYRICDSIGTGIQNYWSERPHGVDMAPAFNDHWVQGIGAAFQIANDNVNFAEAHHHSNLSFPAFFNHRLQAESQDPGMGLIGINLGDGDNWGTWGGYHRWGNAQETSQQWQCTLWLESDAAFSNENAPHDFLNADMAIRRPKAFMPNSGQTIFWKTEDEAGGLVLQSGMILVQSDQLVVVPQVTVYRADIRKIKMTISTQSSILNDPATPSNYIHVTPNPTSEYINVHENWNEVQIVNIYGQTMIQQPISPSQPQLHVGNLPKGCYRISVLTKDRQVRSGQFVKL